MNNTIDAIYYAPQTVPSAPDDTFDESQIFLANPFARLGAALADFAFALTVAAVIPALLYALIPALRAPGSERMVTCITWSCFVLVVLVRGWLTATRGQTVGKMLLGLRVVRDNGAPCGFVRGFLVRDLAATLVTSLLVTLVPVIGPVVLGVVGMIDMMLVFGQDRRRVIDMIAGTRIVPVRAPSNG